MRNHIPKPSAFSTICGCLLLFLLCVDSSARPVPQRRSREGVLDASLVSIVRPEIQDWFRIEEVFLGDQSASDSINVPGFKLYTIQEHGPELVEPMTPDTHILLFLKSKENGWEVTSYGYCFFWRHEPEKAPELRAIAEETVSSRRTWEAARDTVDQQLRVEALWPYLWDQGSSFLEHTERELQKVGPVAGDYIAQKFEAMTHSQLMTLMPNLGAYGSERSHQALIERLKRRQQLYESFLAKRGAGAERLRRPPNGVPIIRLDKSRFALGESVFFWVGVEATSGAPIPKEYQNTCRLIITRPDGTSKTEPIGWPADGPEDSGWLGGWGWGSNETQPGRYTLAFEYAGQRTELVSLFVEDLPILKQIEAEFVFSLSRDGLAVPDGNVALIVRNNSDQTLRFPQPDGVNSMVSVSLSKSDRSYRNDFFYPAESLPVGGNASAISFDTFTWDVASRAPSVTIRPGETYRQEMPLRAALGEAAKGSSVPPGRYDVTFFTTLQILIGEKDGKWSEISPVRVPVSATAACVITR